MQRRGESANSGLPSRSQPVDHLCNTGNRLEIVKGHLVIWNANSRTLLDEHHELQQADRIDHPPVDQGFISIDVGRLLTTDEILPNELDEILFECHGSLPVLRGFTMSWQAGPRSPC